MPKLSLTVVSLISLLLLVVGLTSVTTIAQDEAAVKTNRFHAMSLTGEPKYPEGFKHFDYVNPDAPKGGRLVMSSLAGTFNTLNAFTITGDPAAGLGFVYETLMESSEDDSVSEYGVIAHTVEVAEDLSFVIFYLRPEARFSDGSTITSEDVIFSFHTLRDKGRPFYSKYYANVETATAIDAHTVRFDFSGPQNRELPQIMGQIVVLSKAFWEDRDFEATLIEPPVSSGPYKIGSMEPGRYIEYVRNEDYWGADLPVNVGRFNFDAIRYTYYRDRDVALLAFKAGEYDLKVESSSSNWAKKYEPEDFVGLKNNLVRKELLPHDRPAGMQAFVFNIRKDKFKDRRVREALGYCFDFEYSNKNLFYDQYTRTTSYYANSDFESTGLPSPEELEILNQYKGKIPDEVFTKVYSVPTTDGSGNNRAQLQHAMGLLTEAGWVIQDTKLVHGETGEPMKIEFLIDSASWERIIDPIKQNLERIGVETTTRTVERSQYVNRREKFEFDVIMHVFPQSHSPGNEQRDFWGSKSAEESGGRNVIGIQDPVIDDLIERLIAAPSREQLIVTTRALDRVLLWNHYVIPAWHIDSDRVLWWDKFGRPEIKPRFGIGTTTWWYDEDKAQLIQDFFN